MPFFQTTSVIVSGDRDWPGPQIVHEVLDTLLKNGLQHVLVGCARGVDAFTRDWCVLHQRQITHEVFVAEWGVYKKKAGKLRNTRMAEAGAKQGVRLCLGFVTPWSVGTLHEMSETVRVGIETWKFALPVNRWVRVG